MLSRVSDVRGVMIFLYDLSAEIGIWWDIDSSFVINDSLIFPCFFWVVSHLELYCGLSAVIFSDLMYDVFSPPDLEQFCV